MTRSYSMLDRLAVLPGIVGGERLRYFRQTTDGPTWSDHLALPLPSLPPLEVGEPVDTVVPTLAGDLTVGLLLAHRSAAPRLVVSHHGNNEQPFDLRPRARNSLNRALLQDPPDATIVLLRAAHHGGPLKAHLDAVGDLRTWMAMLAASVLVVESLVRREGGGAGRASLVTGISLGGWVTNLHRAHLGTADRYVPILAGARLGRQMVDSTYRHMLGRAARHDAAAIRRLLDFEDAFRAVDRADVAPLLARRDAYCRAADQADVYPGGSIRWLETGHVGASLARDELRQHVTTEVQRLATDHAGRGSG